MAQLESCSEELVTAFSALSNPTRIEILRHIAECGHCGCKEITDVMPLAQSTVSQHLKVLVQAGLVQMETVPPRSRYKINKTLVQSLSDDASQFLKSCCHSNKF